MGTISISAGELNDHAGKGTNGGESAAKFFADTIHDFLENATTGNIRSHGVIGGISHVSGCVGECPVACNLKG